MADVAGQGEAVEIARAWLGEMQSCVRAVDYEKLISDLEGESRRLIEFLGLEWEPACLDFHRTERPILTASAWQVRQPLYRRSIGSCRQEAWRRSSFARSEARPCCT